MDNNNKVPNKPINAIFQSNSESEKLLAKGACAYVGAWAGAGDSACAGAGAYTGVGASIYAGEDITEAMAGGKFDGGGFDSPMGFIRKLNILYMDIYFIVY